jgi:hypothetical protein
MVVTIKVAGGQTRIRIEEKYSLTEWRLFAPGWGAALGALVSAGLFVGLFGMSEGPGVILPILLGATAGGVLSAHGLLTAMSRGRRPRLEQLADRLTDIAAQSIAARPQLPSGTDDR